MESFKWGEQFITGLPEVDTQHHNLVTMVNEFGSVIAENSSTREYLLGMFQKLADYAIEHFDTEEQLMGDAGVDIRHVTAHVSQHTDFVTEVSSIAESIEDTKHDESQVLLDYLIHWLAFHILGTDQNMARQIDEIEAGASPEESYEKGERGLSSSTEPLVLALTGLFTLVSKRNRALRDLNTTLEARVAERTEELVRANEMLQKISMTDHLTELPNRRYAMKQLQLLLYEMSDSEPLSCMMIDADGFKAINDTYGHDAGDTVLKRLAQELKYSVRSDDIVCRLGGDEFIVICPQTNLEGALILAEQTRNKIASLQVSAGDGFWYGSASIGVACTEPDISEISSLLKAADKAVYEAKRSGRNCVRPQQSSSVQA